MKAVIKKLKAKQVQLAKLRDELRELESEVCHQADRSDEACGSLQDAIDALSELV